MLLFLLLFIVAAFCAPLIMRFGRLGFLALAAVPAAAFCYLLTFAKDVVAGNFHRESFPWVPELGFIIDVRLDHLSWVMGLIVSGVGALVLVYCSRYFSASAQGSSRFAAVFTAFSGAMLGLVTTDNTLALYLFWELTTIFSFLLIGHSSDRAASRRAALQAIIVTTSGGLAMLGGIIILGQIPGGSYSISELITAAKTGTLGVAPILAQSTSQTVLTAAVVLILFGALSKSALIPFHFWLPAAMAAPTPVSAYLHAAAMVKAGVYLVARFAPGFSGYAAWYYIIIGFGLYTMLLGGYRALRQNDLKLVLAFGTVSQLGLLMVLVGYGTKATMLAGLALLIAHALFKSTLFLAVGFLDWATGTRDLRALSGMGRKMPVLAVFTTIAAASMMGLPPLAGFVAKEAALHALIDGEGLDQLSWILIAVGSIFTVGYSLRFLWGAFATKSGVESLEVKPSSGLMLSPIVLLGSLSLLAGFAYKPIEEILAPHANQLPGDAGHLALWSGFNLPLFVTMGVVLLGCGLFLLRVPFGVLGAKLEFPLRADASYQAAIRGLEKLSGVVTGFTQRGSLPAYLSTIFFFALVTGTIALFAGDLETFAAVRAYDSLAQLGVGVITCIAAILGARARHRLKAVLLMGIAGYGVALLYTLYGAPDLALTQVLSETMTLVVFVLVLRRLPAYFSNRPIKVSRWMRIVLAILVGTSAAIITWYAAGARNVTPISTAFHDEAYYFGYGSNIVNVTLVDIRAWDTFGEISVVVAAAIGISSLLFIRDKGARIDRFRNLPSLHPKAEVWGKPYDPVQQPTWTRAKARQLESTVTAPGRNRLWLVGSRTLASPRRSVILEVGTRFIFHTMVIISLYFLFAGHNFPGGGFAAGIMAGIALVLRYIAGGRYELGAAVPLHPGHLLGSGLAIAGVAAITPVFFGGTILQTAKFIFTLPIFGEVKFATALIFDIGVYFVVVGLVLDILRSLGAEIDRHGEVEGIDEQDDVLINPDADLRRELQEASEAESRQMQDAEGEPGETFIKVPQGQTNFTPDYRAHSERESNETLEVQK